MPPVERLAQAATPRGELVLRRNGKQLELISNGTFLMDTSSGASEQTLARLALDGRPAGARVLIGGLGFGFTLSAALEYPVAEVVVVEIERDVVVWSQRWWPAADAALADDRVTVVVDDLVHFLDTAAATYDAVLLDIDNGPDWTVTDHNSALYRDATLGRLAALLAPGGRLCVWSAHAAPAFAARLQRHFAAVTTHQVPVPRGAADLVLVATR